MKPFINGPFFGGQGRWHSGAEWSFVSFGVGLGLPVTAVGVFGPISDP